MGNGNSKSTRNSSRRVAPGRMGKTDNSKIKTKKARFDPSVNQYTTDDGLNITTSSLATHQMAPHPPPELEDWFEENSKPAKELPKEYAVKQAENVFMEGKLTKKAKFEPSVIQYTTDDGLNIKSISLASHQMVPYKFEVLFEENGKPAKELFREYAAIQAKVEIIKGREKDGKGAPPAKIISALGSEEAIYSIADCGMFAAVFTAYSYHYKLRTSPEDWWFCVIKRVACAIDGNSQKESVRKMFVDHEGKKTIAVQVKDPSIYTVDYSWFFDQMAKGIKGNVRVPEFVEGMTADFSNTTTVQRIVSQITLMYSVKQYFDFHMYMGCGIPVVEMLGTEEDWRKLMSKLKVLRTLLEPIENDLGLQSEWWDLVEKVFHKLLETYQGRPDEEWWSHIMDYEQAYSSGIPIGKINMGGWITEFLEETGYRKLRNPSDFTSGLVTVPLTIKHPSGVQDTAALVAGMLGFTVHRTPTSEEVTVQPFQGWSLMLADDSPFL